jgi:hypothetical protein
MGIIRGFIKYKALKKGVEIVMNLFRRGHNDTSSTRTVR